MPSDPEQGVIDDLAHQPHEGQVHGVAEGGAQRHHAGVVGLVEVGKAVQPAAGEEERPGGGGEAPLERGGEQLGLGDLGACDELPPHEGADRIRAVDLDVAQPRPGQRVPALPQPGDDLEILDQGAQLRGRAEVELHAAVHVERLVERVDLRAQHVRVAVALVEREGIDDLRRVAARQQARLAQRAAEAVRVAQVPEHAPHRGLGGHVERGRDVRVQAIELIRVGEAEQREQLRAHRVDGLGLGERGRRAGRRAGIELENRRQRRVAQARVDHAGSFEQHQVAVRQLAQGRAIRDQQGRGAALGEDQREHLPVGARAARQVAGARGSREQRVHLGEVGAVPGPEPIAQPAQLAEAGARGERDAVQVVERDALARGRGVRPVEVRAQRPRSDLAQLVCRAARCSRPASGGTSRAASRACSRPAGSVPPRAARAARGWPPPGDPIRSPDCGWASPWRAARGSRRRAASRAPAAGCSRSSGRPAPGSARAPASGPCGPRSRGRRAPSRGRSPAAPSPSARAGAATGAPGTSPRSRRARAAR